MSWAPHWFHLDRAMRAPLLTAAVLRLGLLAAAYSITGTAVIEQGDTESYLEPGRNLIFHGIFATGGQPEIDRTPGYPLFAMVSGMAFGNVLLAVTAQILLSMIALLLVRRIADLAAPGWKIGVRAAWLYAVEPLSILYAVRLMPETLFVVLLLFSIERLLTFQRSARLGHLATSGIVLALATYVRPVSWYLGFFLAAGLVCTAARGDLRSKAPAVLLLAFLPLLAAWQIRNVVETGYHGFSSIVEKNLYFFQSAGVTAQLQQISLETEQTSLGYPDETAYLAAHPEQRNWPRSERLRFMRTQAMQILARHPWIYFMSHLKGVAVVAFSPCATEWLQMLNAYPAPASMPRRILNEGVPKSIKRIALAHPGVAMAMVSLEVALLSYYALALRGLLLLRKDWIPVLTLIGVATYFLLISGGAQAVGRYRLPILPILCVFAAAGTCSLRAKEMRDHRGPASVFMPKI
jgi:hypothetical protein